MKMIIENGFIALLALLILTPSSALVMTGGDYELSWITIDGGGGRSSCG